jgi:LAS superfamily LD-carboxypeptidase LdcB
MKKILKITAIIIALSVAGYLIYTNYQKEEQLSEKEQRIHELKTSPEGLNVLELWAKEQYALEQKAEAEKMLEEVREASLNSSLE